MVCYEHMRNKTEKTDDNDDIWWRLNSYFIALEQNKIVEYHRKRGRK